MFRHIILRVGAGLALQAWIGLSDPVQADPFPRSNGLPSAALMAAPRGDTHPTAASIGGNIVTSYEGGVAISGNLGSASRLWPSSGVREPLAASRPHVLSSSDGGVVISGNLDAASPRVALGEMPVRSLVLQQLDVTLSADGNSSSN